jgi:site-specific recombinase XerD
LRIDANQQTPLAEGGPKTIAELIAHYRLKELAGEKQGRKAFSTRAGYESYLKGWIVPRWGDHRIDQLKSVAVEEWLDSIKRAKGTKAKILNIMSAIFHHAMRHEWVDRNPIKLVRQSAKRERTPDVLELAELQLLLSKLSVRERTLALLDAATGLQALAPKWLAWAQVIRKNRFKMRARTLIVPGFRRHFRSIRSVGLSECMAGTTGLEPATSAVTE